MEKKGKGCLEDAENLVEALKLVDVVICSIPSKQVLDQRLLIKAIKEAGCIEKFIPSEFGADPDKVQISDMDQNFYSMKSEIRHLIEAEDIPYTYICCNLLMSYLLPSLIQPGLKTPPRDKVTVFGNGNVKGVFVKVEDVAAFTICAIDDPRTLNKVLYLRPSGNVYSLNELVEIWESKIGKKLDRIYVPEDQLLKRIKETPYPDNMTLVFIYSVFVKGDHTYFDIESSGGGDLCDHESLAKAIKQVDVVISTVGQGQIPDQVKIIAAIKEARNITRFLPSEFGNDVDHVHAVEPVKSAFDDRVKIRRAIEAAGIPYTYVVSNVFAGYLLPSFNQVGATAPPRDKVVILGDGNPKAIFNQEDDIATYTIKAVEDTRTLNKILYIRPPANIYSFNDLVSLWEKKIGKTIERIYIPEEQLLKTIQEAEFPLNVIYALGHSVFVKGDQTNFEIEASFGVEGSELYPEFKYTTVDEYLNVFV
ncbi:hypothetical protein GH714_031875 [Hevea brasiliensis]|uniref:NmrA-like domain-containing protein n=1 Tax=Hevea brasiliensis TaxID=3981 RepID=A0A6A6N9L4_HEVBR|nr:hypothetical protein GH714_031875 [Hevea brasiliensis]